MVNFDEFGGGKTRAERLAKEEVSKPRSKSADVISFTDSMAAFKAEFDRILLSKAEDKGYSDGGVSGGRALIDAVSAVAGDGHPPGEIVYKITRYLSMKNPEDLVKIASWAFLMWDQHNREGNK